MQKNTGLTRTASTSSVSSRSTSVSSRNTSNGSQFSSSVGGRPVSYHGSRPQTSMSFNHASNSRTNVPKSRPASSMETSSPDLMHQSRDNDGTRLLHYAISPSRNSLPMKKLRGSQSMQILKSKQSVSNLREFSVSTAMQNLSLNDSASEKESQAISQMLPPPLPNRKKTLSHKQSLPCLSAEFNRMKSSKIENALVLFQDPGDSPAAPRTPSQIPVLSKAEVLIASPNTPCRTERNSPSKTPKQSPFLTKDSNTTGFTAWDMAQRLKLVEAQFSQIKSTVDNGLSDRQVMEQERGMLKQKRK